MALRPLRQVALPLLFEVADKAVALGQVRRSNKRVRDVLAHLGFRLVATLPGAFEHGTDDIVIYRLDRADWRKGVSQRRHGRRPERPDHPER